MKEWYESKWLFPLFVGIFLAIALSVLIPNMPWIHPEIVEYGTVVKAEGGTCMIETESKWILKVDGCNENVGDSVKVKYRSTSSIGELSKG